LRPRPAVLQLPRRVITDCPARTRLVAESRAGATVTNRYLVEFLGTFFLVLTVGLVVQNGSAGQAAPLAIGSALMVMVYAGEHISGAHYNPAVTLAVWIRGRTAGRDVPGYIGAQLIAAVLAAVAVHYFKAETPTPPAVFDASRVLLAEFLFTFALAWVMLNATTAVDTRGNSYSGLAIGFTVATGVYAVGPISGGVFNPAVAVGLAVMGLWTWGGLWVFLIANLAGGAVAAVAFRLLAGEATPDQSR